MEEECGDAAQQRKYGKLLKNINGEDLINPVEGEQAAYFQMLEKSWQ
jgi:hypothetical protein